jgi:hypothetical protein
MQVNRKSAILFGALGLIGGSIGAIALQTHAAGTTTGTTATETSGFKHGTPPAAAGTVTAVSSNTITVTDKRTGTSYIVDGSSATIDKFTPPASGTKPTTKPTPTVITLSQIAVGDNVTIEGTVNGSNIVATKITDGMMFMGAGMGRGSGSRGAMGTVSAVNGSTITLTSKNGTTYTVDAGSATVKKVVDSSVSSIAVGDTLMVNGSTSGTSITANNIVDGALGK